jgi:hypothetical protein
MAEVTAARKMIQIEETQTRGALSESLAQKLGAMGNFINLYQHSEKQFFINGDTAYVTLPFLAVDGFTFFQYNATIIDVWMYVQTNGASGTLELDLKRATTPGGAFSSIFTTTPKIQAAAGNNIWIHVGSAVANTTAPVLSVTDVNAGDAIRCDIIQSPAAGMTGCGIIIHYRPR